MTVSPNDGNCIFNYPDPQIFKNNLLDGIDLDLEGIKLDQTNPKCHSTMIDYVNNFKRVYNNNCIVTSAPQSPMFRGDSAIDYSKKEIWDLYDFLNIQFYNNTPPGKGCEHHSYDWFFGPATNPKEGWGESNITYLTETLNIPKSKIVIGTVGQNKADVYTQKQYIGGKLLQSWVDKNNLKGIMYWEWIGYIPGKEWLNDNSTRACD